MPLSFRLASNLITFTLFPFTIFILWAFIRFHVSNGLLDKRELARNFVGFLIGLTASWIVIALDTFYKKYVPDPELRIQPALLRVGIYILMGIILGMIIDKLTGALHKRNLTSITIAFFTVFIVLSIYDLVILKEIRYVISFGILGWVGYLIYGNWSEKNDDDDPGSFLDRNHYDSDESEFEIADLDGDAETDRSRPGGNPSETVPDIAEKENPDPTNRE